jgi:valyl-tRNA synthetase
MLDKTFEPKSVEARHSAAWLAAGAFDSGKRPGAKPYTIVIPPPNVTGSLHMGHALNNTLQDVLVRWKRMQGFDVLWQPGTDHAGIATQMVVERQLAAQGITLDRKGNANDPKRIGRKAFLEKVWTWKEESGGTIVGQLKRLGASCDWRRERFTMDGGLSRAVTKVFVALAKQGLIYKDQRLVNWDPKLETAISDLEVQSREVKGKLWYLRYPVKERPGEFVTVATTRPETMLGDTGIAVHPEDARTKHLIGLHAILPLVGRELPIVGDEYADPEKGSGAVKITPAHDFNDFEVGRRHKLPAIGIFDRTAHVTDAAPAAYLGLERFAARERVLADLTEQGLVEKIEEITHSVPYGDRSGVPVEPYLTEQWYADAATLAAPAIAAVEDGRTKFVPAQWSKTYFEWLRNIQPWCISRQLWWGHQIPAWYGPDGKVFVEETEAAAAEAARAHYGKPVLLKRDEDVLDTWFSSALWPFSTLGWPDATPELARHYPTDVLVTGFDIIFFWVARMMMMGLHLQQQVPFHTVYIHALVRDEQGQKMSKSKGNVMDPLELIERFGADALRFTLAAMAAQGRDVKLSAARVEGFRNFATKLWNAARFAEMNGCAFDPAFDPTRVSATLNRWIIGEAARAGAELDASLEAYKFDQAALGIYHFAWGSFCDWYLELAKPVLQGTDGPAGSEARATVAWVLARVLHLLHPFMPFVTEELWAQFRPAGAGMLVLAEWPKDAPNLHNAEAEAELGWVVRLVSAVRAVRAEMNVPAGARIDLIVRDAGATSRARLDRNADQIKTLARLATIALDGAMPKGAAQLVLDEATLVLPLEGVIDIAAERRRLEKEIARLDGEVGKIDGKLGDEKFLARAPAEVVEEQRERRGDALDAKTKLATALGRLG